jgi:hypothetical protein
VWVRERRWLVGWSIERGRTVRSNFCEDEDLLTGWRQRRQMGDRLPAVVIGEASTGKQEGSLRYLRASSIGQD